MVGGGAVAVVVFDPKAATALFWTSRTAGNQFGSIREHPPRGIDVIPTDTNKVIEWSFSREQHAGGNKATCPCGANRCAEPAGSPLPDASVFLIGAPTDRQRAAILDVAAAMSHADEEGNRSISIRTGSLRRLRIRFGLRGVKRNFPGWESETDPHGGGLPVPTDAFLASIPDSAAIELDEAIAALTDVSEEEVGKSDAPSEARGSKSLGKTAETAGS